MNNTKKPSLGLTGFFMMTGSMVMTIYSYPAFATSGFSLVFFLVFAGLLFFIPVALVAAELATGEGWQTGGVYTGGVYTWVAAAFGKRWGFTAIFLQWLQITVGFVTMLYFIVGALSYVLDWPALNTNPVLKLAFVLAIFWLVTLFNFNGTSWTARLATIGLIGGVSIPAFILIGLAITYIVQGDPMQIKMGMSDLLPDFKDVQTLVVLVAFILSYAGIEASAPHVNDLENPKRNYPLAIILLTVFAIVINILGALAIAIVIPESKINLSAGVLQTFQVLLDQYHFAWALKPVAILLALGTVAEVSAWVVGPAQGMFTAAKEGLLPPVFTKVNNKNVPIPFILAQGVVVTIWAVVLTLGGGGNNLSFLLAMALTVVTYLAMYILLFLAYFVLKTKRADVERAYNIPGGNAGGFLVAGAGLLMVLLSMVISFFPPTSVTGAAESHYVEILLGSFVVSMIIPHVIFAFCCREKTDPAA
ncbi:MAG: APC family permease [Verrucomicrobiae bacterium]